MSAQQDVVNAARSAGFAGDALVTAIAISLAEDPSSDPYAHCLDCAGVSEDSRGIFQINLNAHPNYDNVNLFDPLVNARAAFAISSGGTNWNPWSTYTGGQYLTHLAEAAQLAGLPLQGSPASPQPPPLGSIVNGVPAVLSSIWPASAPPSRRWLTAGIIAAVVYVAVFE